MRIRALAGRLAGRRYQPWREVVVEAVMARGPVRLGVVVVGLLLGGLRGAPPAAAQQAGSPEDSLVPAAVYVPAACAQVGATAGVPARRCPLVVFPQVPAYLARAASVARAMIDWQRTLADQYGAILLVPAGTGLPGSTDTLLQRVLRTYPVDSAKVALTGYRVSGENGCADLTLFRQVALLSSSLWVCEGTEARPQPPGRVYLAGGLGEPRFVSETVWQGRKLRRAGQTLTSILALRGYGADQEDFERLWRWLSEGWTTSVAASAPTPGGAGAAASAAEPTTMESLRARLAAELASGPAVSDSEAGPRLTARALAQLTTFWRQFLQAPDSIQMAARQAQQRITVPVWSERFTLSMMDTPALAERYSTVRAALQAAGLTAWQADAYRRALIVAAANRRLPEDMVLPPVAVRSRLGQNLAFMQAHQDALKVLGNTGMWTTP